MLKGTLKWFNAKKGYGFICPEIPADKDVFLHVTALEKAGIRHIPDGQLLSYSISDDRGRQAATNIKFI